MTNERVTLERPVARRDMSRALAFGPFVAEADTGRLLESGRAIPLAPKPFETLCYLVSHPGRVVRKAELMERLWPATFVTDDMLVQCVVDIRRALHDPARNPQYVQTVPRRGYRFLAPVREAAAGDCGAPYDPAPEAVPVGALGAVPARPEPSASRGRGRWWAAGLALALLAATAGWLVWKRSQAVPPPSEPSPTFDPGSLLVMPLTVEGPTPEGHRLRQELADRIRSQLGRTPGVRVVPRHRLDAALADAGYTEDSGPPAEGVSGLARRLRAKSLVTGSLVRVGGQFLLTAQVTDVATDRTEGYAAVRGRHPDDLSDAVAALCQKLLDHVTVSPGPAGQARER